ncbi:flavodoxin [candidate division WOR-3 bacterium]|nr:flavodoxin [candidate division WOR-3 bacterium]
MKVLVAYLSRTGNTRKVAEAIAGEIEVDKDVKKFNEIESLDAYNLAFIGFPIERFGPAKEAVQFLAMKAIGKKVALFITHAAPEELPHLATWMEKCRQAAMEAELLGVFNCRGDLARQVRESMLKSEDPQLRAWGEASKPMGSPDEARLERARAFAKEVLEKI